ncbi:hypothetical protein HDU96_001260, partial [Phlyctochytrium bullatum]
CDTIALGLLGGAVPSILDHATVGAVDDEWKSFDKFNLRSAFAVVRHGEPMDLLPNADTDRKDNEEAKEILVSALERQDIETITDKLQFELTQPEAVPRLPWPNTALILLEELYAIVPHDFGSGPSNDPAPAEAIPSVEVLPVNKEASITERPPSEFLDAVFTKEASFRRPTVTMVDELDQRRGGEFDQLRVRQDVADIASKDVSVIDTSEASSGGSGSSTLEFSDETCERNKMVSLATNVESNLPSWFQPRRLPPKAPS